MQYSTGPSSQKFSHGNFCSSETDKLDDGKQKKSQFLWIKLYSELEANNELLSIIFENVNFLFVSKKRFVKQKKLNPIFRRLVEEFDPQNCLKAISVAKDLTFLKHNQYKFMYRGLTLGHAVRLLINESFFLNRTLTASGQSSSQFRRLINNWISFLFIIHGVHESFQKQLQEVINESIDLRLSDQNLFVSSPLILN